MTAIGRRDFSGPIRQALSDAVIQPGRSVHDYGCGLGGDMDRLRRAGYEVTGWDPHHLPQGEKRIADVVNLGFVLNVIEIPEERISTATYAFQFANLVLIIGVRPVITAKSKIPHGDGFYIDNKGTFQKAFSDAELKEFVERNLRQQCHIASRGIGYVFKDARVEAEYLATRRDRRSSSG